MFLNLTAFSQTLVLNKDKDTTICFSVDRAKFLIKEHYRADEYFKLDSLCELKSKKKDLEIKMYKKIQEDLEKVISNTNDINLIKDDQIKALKLVIEDKDSKIKAQKVYKWISIGAGVIFSGFLGYKYITK